MPLHMGITANPVYLTMLVYGLIARAPHGRRPGKIDRKGCGAGHASERSRDDPMIVSKFMKGYRYAVVVALLGLAAGCTSYYRVTDPTTGKVYYTTDMHNKGSGATELKDAKTGDTITIQNSEVSKIDKEAFEAGKYAALPATMPAMK